MEGNCVTLEKALIYCPYLYLRNLKFALKSNDHHTSASSEKHLLPLRKD